MNVEAPKEKRKTGSHVLRVICFAGGIAACSTFAAWVAARLNGESFGLYTWPFIVCTALFLFTTVGFFSTEKGTEALYLICLIVSALCGIMQLAILF